MDKITLQLENERRLAKLLLPEEEARILKEYKKEQLQIDIAKKKAQIARLQADIVTIEGAISP